ncbi:hypothetical protein N9A49_00235 [Salibacteraceae bacterium]|nr:hypothetical protein [Salibacteraceae bacterium]
MNQSNESLDALKDIKSLMERSSRFISLSGLAGVFSGVFALIGAAAAYWRVNLAPWAVRDTDTRFGTGRIVDIDIDVATFLGIDALLVLLASILVSYYFTKRKASRKQQPLWGTYSKHMLLNLSIPLVTGGLFCVLLFSHGLIGLIAPTTLIFYGLALVNAGRFSLEEISYLGLSEIILGLMSFMMLGFGLIFWAVGFGLLHIVYGILMYYRHDR